MNFHEFSTRDTPWDRKHSIGYGVIQILEFFLTLKHCKWGFSFSAINFSVVDHHIPAPLFESRCFKNFLEKLFD